MIQTARYRHVLAVKEFRFFWLGFTISTLGDTMSKVALTWFVYELTNSPEALGLLSLTYTGPVIIGGLFAGWLLDRYDRTRVLMIDNIIRGCVFAIIPLLYAFNALELWHIYVISAVYGVLMMISLAGSPSLVPDLVHQEHLATANALETLSYTISATVGPLIAGFLIPVIGAANIVTLDALSYFVFAAFLYGIQPTHHDAAAPDENAPTYKLRDAVKLLTGNAILSSTTLMFMLFNMGFGALLVWLPILADQTLNGGAALYGAFLTAMAVGELVSSSIVGTLDLKIPLGRLICAAQICSGLAVAVMLVQLSVFTVFTSMVLLGFFSVPLTIWAQTLRMKIIPPQLRGRTFALLRMLMQSTFPAGGTVAGFVLASVPITTTIAISALVIGLPGAVGTRVKALWNS